MNEWKKTLACLVAGAIFSGGAAWSYFRQRQVTLDDAGETKLVEGFTGGAAVTSLKITRLEPKVPRPRSLELVKGPGGWVVASHENYPAGEMERVADVANSLSQAKIIATASDAAEDAGDHERFGVVDPENMEFGQAAEAVGARLVVKEGDRLLGDVIIGKEVPAAKANTRYVRLASSPIVYEAMIPDTGRLSTKFDDWIATKVLDVASSFDIRSVRIDDSTFFLAQDRDGSVMPALERRGLLDLTYQSEGSKWEAGTIQRWDEQGKKYVPQPLTPAEELKTQALNDLTFALSDLKIVSASRLETPLEQILTKLPPGRIAPLDNGFYLARPSQDPALIYAQGGELQFGTKEGLEYTVSFGSEAGLGEQDDKPIAKPVPKKPADKPDGKVDPAKKDADQKDADQKDAEKKDDDTKLNRYLLVSVRFNESLMDKPKLEPVPDDKPAAKPAEEKPAVDKPAEKKEAEKKPAPPKPDDKQPDDKQPDDKKSVEQKPDDKQPDEKKSDDKPEEKKSAGAPSAAPFQLVATQAEKKAEESKADPAKSAKPVAPAPPAEPQVTLSEATKELKDAAKRAVEDRQRILADNEKKRKEHQEKVEQAKKKATELNARLSAWYYVISEDTYKKLHLTRADIVQKKEAKDESAKPPGPPFDPAGGPPFNPAGE